MSALNIGVELAGLRLPLKQALHTAALLGVDAVEIDARGEVSPGLSQTGVRQVRKMLDDLNLRVAAVSFRTRRGYDATADLDSRVAATKAAMEFAYRLGASVVVNHVGRVPDDRGSAAWRLLVDVLDELGRHGNRVGARLAAQTGTESGETLARLLAELPDGALGVDLHPGNLVLGGFFPMEAIEALGPSILHVHAADAIGELAGRRASPAPLGQGTTDFPAVLAALDQYGYRGYFTVEHREGDNPSREIARAVQYLRGQLGS